MPDATITSTASTFGTISGTFAADQSTIAGTITAITGTVNGSVGVPGPQGPQGVQGIQGIQGDPGAPGQGVAAGGSAGQVLQKLSATSYDTGWLTLPADYINSVTAPLAVASGNLSVDLSAYLPKAGGYITGDIQSSNGSGYRSSNGTNLISILEPGTVVVNNSSPGHGSLTIDAEGISFYSSPYKQTVPFLGLAGYATEAWVTAGFYPLTGNPSGFLTSAPVTSVAGRTGAITLTNTDISGLGSLAVVNDAPSNGSQYARKNAAWDVVIPGDRYLTTSTTSLTINNANKTLTVGTGLSYTPTQNITISYDAANHMHGEVLTYSTSTGVLTVDVNHHTGSGTYAAWVVNVGGVTPATSVAWGGITGTLSTQTDLQNALDLKLDATTAASTYYLQTNPDGFITSAALSGYATESWVASQDYLTNAAAASTYQTLAGMSSYAALGGALFTGLVQVKTSNGAGAGLRIPTGTAPSSPLDGEIWNSGSLGLKVQLASVTETLANQSWVSNAYAPKASPTFSGTPSLPTGTIATTQSPGNNTTAVATTAFVTAAVPAFATTEQAALNSSATTLISPANSRVAGLTTNVWAGTASGLSSIVLGTGANIGSGYTILNGRLLAPLALTLGYASRGFTLQYGSNAGNAAVNYGTASGHAVRVYTQQWGNTVAGVKMRGIFGRRGGSIPAPAPLAERGYGWEWDFSTRTMRILAHNGTTLTNPSVTWNPSVGRTYEIMVTSSGTGTISLYIDNTLMGTTTGGPNDLIGNSAPVWWQTEIQNEVTAGGQLDFLFQNPKLYNTNG